MLRTRLNDALKDAMKSKDTIALATVRLILAALKDRDIAARSNGKMDGIVDDDILSMLQSMVKQRRDSIEMYEKGGRPELAEREANEIDIIERFLPEQMGEEEMLKEVTAVIKELGATSMKDMGRVMGVLKERHAGGMDFSQASTMVKKTLG